ncbi:hypothetical protein [Bradyrhizobium sp.]|uniref:hypothetical protein n=1 Tax=Bradyrhizobium sp. TaxID=376 RepID=UPI002D4B7BF5|nr:hypothetical protein [Bradyrhizobium sp.]HZR73820.1 hypothetical protein [Bradyrhizobium sp.]
MTPEPEAPVQIQETAMIDPCFALDQEQTVDTMIALTHPSTLGGIIITGSESMELYLVLRRRGYSRVATPVTCRAPKRQHAVGLVTGQNAVAALVQASPFLSTNSNVAVLIESRDGELAMNIRHKLQQMGFRIEAGVRCRRGLVLAADRRGFSQLELAA